MEVTVAQPQSVIASPAPGVAEQPAPLNFVQRVNALPMQRKLMLAGGLAAMVAIFIAMLMWGRQGDFKVLYANLSDKDGGAIVASLQQMNVPYKYADGGGAILVRPGKGPTGRLKVG